MGKFLAIAISLTLAACASAQEDGDVVEDKVAPAPTIPEGAIQTGGNMYMVPLDALDRDGCQGYRQVSPGNMVTMAIYYIGFDGKFTANKLDTECYTKAHAKD